MTDDNTDSDPAEETAGKTAKKTPKKKTKTATKKIAKKATKKTAKKATKKTAKKAPPRPKPPTPSDLIKRVKSLEEEVKKLKARPAGRDVADADADEDDLETTADEDDLETTADEVSPIVAVSERVRTMHELLMGPMTTTIRKMETRVAAFEERLDDCEALILEKTQPEKDNTNANPESSGT